MRLVEPQSQDLNAEKTSLCLVTPPVCLLGGGSQTGSAAGCEVNCGHSAVIYESAGSAGIWRMFIPALVWTDAV